MHVDHEMASRETDDARIERQFLNEELTELTIGEPSLAEMLEDQEFKCELDEWWDSLMEGRENDQVETK